MPGLKFRNDKNQDDSSSKLEDILRTPRIRRYSDAVVAESRRTKDAYLQSGLHYEALARFLSNESSIAQIYGRSSFPHVVVETITKDGRESTSYRAKSDPEKVSITDGTDANRLSLVFLRGFTSSLWLNRICELTNVHPEYFRRQLNFIDRNEFFDLPALPSGSKNILRLRITTICIRPVPLTPQEIDKSRKEEEDNIVKHYRALSTSGSAGDSIVRRYAVHNETIFTLGQDISCLAKPSPKPGGSWTGLVWLDVGRDLYERSPGPWFADEGNQGLSGNHTCLPVIQHRSKSGGASTSVPTSLVPSPPPRSTSEPSESPSKPPSDPAPIPQPKSPIKRPGPRLGQSAALLTRDYGAHLDRGAMHADALYAFSDLVAFAATSEKQFLNMVTVQIERDLRLYLDYMDTSLANITYAKTLLDEHLRTSRETLAGLKVRGGPHWPRIGQAMVTKGERKEDEGSAEEREAAHRRMRGLVEDTVADLIADYEFLVAETEALIQRCMEGSDLITSRASLDESRKAGEQNSRISRLTTLAFLFVPTTFVGTFFGMNFSEFGQGDMGVWVGILVMVLFIGGSVAFCYFDELSLKWRNMLERRRLAAARRNF